MTKESEQIAYENADDFIRISSSVKEKLKGLKIYPRESYSEVIHRLIINFREEQ